MTDYDKFKQHSLNVPNDSKYINISDEMTESINDEMYKDVDIQLKKCDISPSNTSLLELQKYIPKFDDVDIEKNTNKYIKWIIKQPNTDLFETITRDISNIYFDIDLPKNVKEIGLTKLQMNNIINDLIIKFNKYYKL